MLKSVHIASRDDRCRDCKLTAKSVRIREPTWWQRWFLKAGPVTEIVTEIWYGRENFWETGPCKHEVLESNDKEIFYSLWRRHCERKKELKFRGTYKTEYIIKAGKWELKDSTR